MRIALESPAAVAPRYGKIPSEMPLWLLLAWCSFVPSSFLPWIEIDSIPLRLTDLGIVAVGAGYIVAALFTYRGTGRLARFGGLSGPMALAVGAALVSLLWTRLEGESLRAMVWTLVVAALCAGGAVAMLADYSSEQLYRFLWRLTGFLAFVSAVYAGESIFSLGLRSELGRNTLTDFGIERVRGPLYGSSTGYLALLPALGFAIQHLVDRRRLRGWGLLMVFALMTALLGLGSRAALLLLSVFFLLLSFLIKNGRKRVLAILVMVALTGSAAAMVFAQASTVRLQNFEDDLRRTTHTTALRSLEEQPWPDTLRGAGYGEIWNWYLIDSRRAERLQTGDNLTRTPFGVTLYHSHSTLLLLVMELGAAGLVVFFWMSRTIVRGMVSAWRSGHLQIASCALPASFLGFLFDLFLFKNSTVNLVWWLYALPLVAIAAGERRPRGR